jgi:hypothetical protein
MQVEKRPLAGSSRTYRYRPEVIEELWRHGVHPTAATPPQLVYEFVSDLYRFELRRLRDRLVRKEIPKAGYYDRVVELRRRYPLVSFRADSWVE